MTLSPQLHRALKFLNLPFLVVVGFFATHLQGQDDDDWLEESVLYDVWDTVGDKGTSLAVTGVSLTPEHVETLLASSTHPDSFTSPRLQLGVRLPNGVGIFSPNWQTELSVSREDWYQVAETGFLKQDIDVKIDPVAAIPSNGVVRIEGRFSDASGDLVGIHRQSEGVEFINLDGIDDSRRPEFVAEVRSAVDLGTGETAGDMGLMLGESNRPVPPEFGDTIVLGQGVIPAGRLEGNAEGSPFEFTKAFSHFNCDPDNPVDSFPVDVSYQDPTTGIFYNAAVGLPAEGSGKADTEPPSHVVGGVVSADANLDFSLRFLTESVQLSSPVSFTFAFVLQDNCAVETEEVVVFVTDSPLREGAEVPQALATLVDGNAKRGKYTAKLSVNSRDIDWDKVRENVKIGKNFGLRIAVNFVDVCNNENTAILGSIRLFTLSPIPEAELADFDLGGPFLEEIVLGDSPQENDFIAEGSLPLMHSKVLEVGVEPTSIRWRARAVDTGSGVERFSITFTDPLGLGDGITINSDSAESVTRDGDTFTYEGEFTLPAYAVEGNYTVSDFSITDLAGNNGSFINPDITLDELSFEVINPNADIRRPFVNSVALVANASSEVEPASNLPVSEKASDFAVRDDTPPIEVTVPESGLDVTLAVNASDDQGVDSVGFQIVNSRWPYNFIVNASQFFVPQTGDATSGTFNFAFNLAGGAAGVPSGTYQILAFATDVNGRQGVSGVSLPLITQFAERPFLEGPSLLVVNNPALPVDPNPARPELLSISGSATGDSAEGPTQINLQFEAAHVFAVTQSNYVTFRSPSGAEVLSFPLLQENVVSQEESRVTFNLDFELNQYSEGGLWQVVIGLAGAGAFRQFSTLYLDQPFPNEWPGQIEVQNSQDLVDREPPIVVSMNFDPPFLLSGESDAFDVTIRVIDETGVVSGQVWLRNNADDVVGIGTLLPPSAEGSDSVGTDTDFTQTITVTSGTPFSGNDVFRIQVIDLQDVAGNFFNYDSSRLYTDEFFRPPLTGGWDYRIVNPYGENDYINEVIADTLNFPEGVPSEEKDFFADLDKNGIINGHERILGLDLADANSVLRQHIQYSEEGVTIRVSPVNRDAQYVLYEENLREGARQLLSYPFRVSYSQPGTGTFFIPMRDLTEGNQDSQYSTAAYLPVTTE